MREGELLLFDADTSSFTSSFEVVVRVQGCGGEGE